METKTYAQMYQEAQEWVQKQVAIEREQMRLARVQREQARQIAQHEERIEKVEEEQRKIRFLLNQIMEDLPVLKEELSMKMGQIGEWESKLRKAEMDIEWDNLRMREAPSAVKGKELEAHRKAKATAQDKIISLKKQIRAAEKKIATAEFQRDEYRRKLS